MPACGLLYSPRFFFELTAAVQISFFGWLQLAATLHRSLCPDQLGSLPEPDTRIAHRHRAVHKHRAAFTAPKLRMQAPHFVTRPCWNRLPPELLTVVFQHLGLHDLMRAESCCRSWYRLLTNPQVLHFLCSAVWFRRLAVEHQALNCAQNMPHGLAGQSPASCRS